MPRESAVYEAIKAWLGSLGCEVRKLHGNEYSVQGDPDLYGCYKGRMFHIETKQPKKHAEKIQEYRLSEWQKAGAHTGVGHSLAEAKALMEPWIAAVDYEEHVLREYGLR
jgi:hypothetical protein